MAAAEGASSELRDERSSQRAALRRGDRGHALDAVPRRYGVDWTSAGRMEGGAVASGEGWRAITALTLHVDLDHLVSNLVFGGLFGILAAQALGPGVAWLGTVLAGILGNALESFLVDPTHRAIGASTAIFGTLGLMTAAEWTRRGRGDAPWVRRVAPLFGGAVLFGWLGVGDGTGRVDVLAPPRGSSPAPSSAGPSLAPGCQSVSAVAARDSSDSARSACSSSVGLWPSKADSMRGSALLAP